MSQRRSTRPATAAADAGRLGRRLQSVGVALAGTAAPLVCWTLIALLAGVGGVDAALAVVAGATGGPLVGPVTVARLFSVGLTGLAAGLWCLGAGLLLEGLSG
ncbi:hypothetical protein [Haloarcula litorea]|uniref:hypothetical protein n=1 Tax=Haloarcula litorea TaxID=3032579 RepID=UPI0023E85CE0|nr:hypothetical protein [Halomicroarcula sp. GDY20]